MENPSIVRQNIFDYIDSLQDVESAKAAESFLDDKQLKRIFWEAFNIYFTTKSKLEKHKAKLKCKYIRSYYRQQYNP